MSRLIFILMSVLSMSAMAQSGLGRVTKGAAGAAEILSEVIKTNPDRPKSKYKTGERFHPGGYEINCSYGRIYLKRFADNDSLFYLQKPYRRDDDGRKYYFLIVNSEVKDSILDNALNKGKHKLIQRYRWMNSLLSAMMIDNIESPKSHWTKHATISNGQLNGSYYGCGWVPLTFQRALRAYYDQRYGISGTELLGALILKNWICGNKDENSRNQEEEDRRRREYEDRLYDEYLRQRGK